MRFMMLVNEEMVKAWVLIAGDGLRPSSKGTRVTFSGAKRTFTGGPFAETEVRRVFEAEDFPAEVFPLEEVAREERLRDELPRRAKR